jgi:imidazole glycerol-phosphate synthase subunit HisF
MTEPEKILWSRIKGSQLGCRFKSQYIMHGWIVDFYCPSYRLVIEVDGTHHNEPDQLIKDNFRDKIMIQSGYRVMRFTNYDVYNNLDRVLNIIKSHFSTRIVI